MKSVTDQDDLCRRCQVNVADISVYTITPDDSLSESGNTTVERICQSCDDKDRFEKFEKDGEISTALWMASALAVRAKEWHRIPEPIARRVVVRMDEVRESVDHISAARLSTYLQASERSMAGVSGAAADFKVMGLVMAGRGLITLSDVKRDGRFGGAWISLIYDASSKQPKLGIQGLCATKEEAMALVRAFDCECPELRDDHDIRLL